MKSIVSLTPKEKSDLELECPIEVPLRQYSKAIKSPQRNVTVLQSLKAGYMLDMTHEKIATLAGIDVRTLHRWRNKSQQLCHYIEVRKMHTHILAKIAMRQALDRGDSKMVMRVIKVKDKRYRFPQGTLCKICRERHVEGDI